jgi:hypothetical protein
MKILVTPKQIIRATSYPSYRGRRIFAANEDINEDDTEFGDLDDEDVSDDVEEAFNRLVEKLRDASYEELGDELEEVVSDPKLYALLKEGFGNGELAKVKMSTQPTAIAVTQLLPTQSEIGLDNSLKYPLSQDCSKLFNSPVTIVAPIVTYRKTFVIDGHHRWSQLYMMNPNAKITAINFNYSEQSPFRALRNFQGAIAVAHKEVPKQYSKVNNVYEMSDSAIEKYVDENISDACWKSLVNVGVAEDRDSAIDYILDNIDQLKDENKPYGDAPAREYMPQTDEKSIKIAEEGQTNI